MHSKVHKITAYEAKSEMKKLQEMDVNVELSWSDAHANIKDNEFADQLVN